LKGQHKRSEKINNPKTAMKKRADPTATNKTKPNRRAQLNTNAEASKLTSQITRTY